MNQLTATQCYSVEQKKKFVDHFVRFVNSGYKHTLFFDWFYKNLSNTFGHIAHYNKHGFYAEFFESQEGLERFWKHVMQHGCYGDPAYTFVDCEIAIREHYRNSGRFVYQVWARRVNGGALA